ncbi:cation transporter dimerization domain-containing protein [Methylobacterium sp. BE186]|uniref:cation transporter dimerization domain-containing protein n=1 Tax=Methylobacterium sp. BE186 TaxID=2817715 RepID=UPI00286AC0B6|nr:cation transporter dimerization domain-containing protein [Methylobacterium sp. BE186]
MSNDHNGRIAAGLTWPQVLADPRNQLGPKPAGQVTGAMTVEQAHEICDRLEAALRAAVEAAVVSIHVEPDHKAKHSGIRFA